MTKRVNQNSRWQSWRLLGLLLAGIPFLLAAGPGLAQSSGGAAIRGGKSLEDLGKELNNPISSVWNITTQSNLYFY